MKEVAKKYDKDINTLYYNIYMLNCEKVHSDFSGIMNDYLIVSNDKIEINADITKDINYTYIIKSLEAISKKLEYIDFNW